MTLAATERHVMEHATAWRHRNRLYRNRYVAGPDQDSWSTLQSLVERGLMEQRTACLDDMGGMAVFVVTNEGLRELAVQP